MSDEGGLSEDECQLKHLRLIGWGIVAAGLATLVVASVSTRPHAILVYGLLGLAVAVLVLEKAQGGATGLSLGLLTGSFGVWA
jgi:F0F1-type ATP synthase assembly protein I